ncbi:FkbM family methyltransferase [Candidatus Pelagibacter sp.]|nr:FkbM family methyltransferase [Candidatus Pelagibacter sp.]
MSIIKFLIKFPILKRLIPSFYKKYIFFFNKYTKKVIINNVIYDLDLRHLIDRRFFFHNGYEDELFNPLNNIINKNKIDFFLDIGSCWGVYSLRLAGIHKNLKILAFDPIKTNIERLNISIKKNKFENIECFHTAIGSKKDKVTLGATEKYSPNYEINEINSVINETSELNSLDFLLETKDKSLILKIDTEGYEFEVLKGAINLLKNNKCFCQIEIKDNNKEKVFSFLNDLNYNLVSINRKNKTDFFFSNFIEDKIQI